MIAIDAVAALRPRPSGPPLRGRATLRDGIMEGRLVGRRNTEQGTAGSTLSSPTRGRTLGVGAIHILICRTVASSTSSSRRSKSRQSPLGFLLKERAINS